MAHYVYELTVRCKQRKEELKYIGETGSTKDRFYQHRHGLTEGKHDNPYLQTFYNYCYYPEISFKILYEVRTRRQGKKIEKQEVLARDLKTIANIEYTSRENKAKLDALKTVRRRSRNQAKGGKRISRKSGKYKFKQAVLKEIEINSTAVTIMNQWYPNARRASEALNITTEEIIRRVESNDPEYREWIYYKPPRIRKRRR